MSVPAAVSSALARRSLPALGSSVELVVSTPRPAALERLFDEAEAEIERLEQVFSRFRPDSELSALNAAGSLAAGEELLEVVELALAAREATAGRFDPTVHDALVAAGYDRTFRLLPQDRPGGRDAARTRGGVAVDRGSGTVSVEAGFRLDLGGIAKGWIADRVADLLAEAGPCLVNAGGDLAVRGLLDGGPWPVAVDVPGEPLTLGLAHGGLATSGADHRTWRIGGVEQHHLIDPASGRPSSSDLLRVTVAAGSAADAEIWAKALFLAGAEGALAEARERAFPCVLVTRDERVLVGGGLA